MRTLPLTFKYDGFILTQLERHGDIALYGQYRGERLNSLEVIRVQYRKARPMPDGRMLEEGEYYPQSNQWGDMAWTFRTREAADAKIHELLQQQETRRHAATP